MDYLSNINDALLCTYLAITFLMVIELRYSMKLTMIVLFGYLAISAPIYFYLINVDVNRGLSSALVFSMPSLIICFFLSKYKGFRFIFTFCTVDLTGFVVLVVARGIAIPFADNEWVIFGFINLLFGALIWAAYKTRSSYLRIQRTITTGWRNFGIVAILFYVLMYLMNSYPIPLYERREYLPVVIMLTITMIFVYIVIYQAVMKTIKIYDEEKNKQLLETKLALQDSRLELEEMYEKMAYTDILTGLKNRLAFEEKKAHLESSKKDMKSLACLMIDLNNLKETNDNYGHVNGDDLLKRFSNILRETFDHSHTIYRVGGDEFVMLFEDMTCKDVHDKLLMLRTRIEHMNQTNPVKISFAAGLADNCDQTTMDIDDLVSCADRKMYQNKKRIKAQMVDD